jgi:hypothetical protein
MIMFEKRFILFIFMLCSVQGNTVILKDNQQQQLVRCSNPSLLELQSMLYEADVAYFMRMVTKFGNSTVLVAEKNNVVQENIRTFYKALKNENLVLCPTNTTLENNPERYPFQIAKKVCACKNCRFIGPTDLYECAPVMNEIVVLKRGACMSNGVYEWKASKTNVTVHCGCRMKLKKKQQLSECSNPSSIELQSMLYEAKEAELTRMITELGNNSTALVAEKKVLGEKRLTLSVYQNNKSLVLCPTNVTLENNPERYPFKLEKKVCTCKNCRFGVPADLYECAPVMNQIVVLKRGACMSNGVYEWKASNMDVTVHCVCIRKF